MLTTATTEQDEAYRRTVADRAKARRIERDERQWRARQRIHGVLKALSTTLDEDLNLLIGQALVAARGDDIEIVADALIALLQATAPGVPIERRRGGSAMFFAILEREPAWSAWQSWHRRESDRIQARLRKRDRVPDGAFVLAISADGTPCYRLADSREDDEVQVRRELAREADSERA